MKLPPLTHLLNAVLPPLLWSGLIFILSSQPVLPGFDVGGLDFLFKKTAHIGVYFVLYFLVWRGVAVLTSPKQYRTRLFAPLVICLLYAMSDELHQSFVPGRSATLRDVGYDSLGMAIAFLRIYRYI